ncbi:hypothetical protein MtrunA17_Chr3g0103581 [Medicago truncatula]|nr:hypothetical protein MtrunA17_Chr3g0103581 [Medicago truncatula]
MSLPATIYIFHFSGVVGCETLLWIILSQFSNWCIVNSFILVVTFVCHTNCIKLVHKLSCRTLDLFFKLYNILIQKDLFFLSKHSNSDVVPPPPNSEPQEASQV